MSFSSVSYKMSISCSLIAPRLPLLWLFAAGGYLFKVGIFERKPGTILSSILAAPRAPILAASPDSEGDFLGLSLAIGGVMPTSYCFTGSTISSKSSRTSRWFFLWKIPRISFFSRRVFGVQPTIWSMNFLFPVSLFMAKSSASVSVVSDAEPPNSRMFRLWKRSSWRACLSRNNLTMLVMLC